MKIGLDFVSPLNLMRQRFLFASAALSPIIFLNFRKFPRDSETLRRLLVYSLINVPAWYAMLVGLVHETSGIASVLTYTQPLFVFCLAIPILKEKMTLSRIVGTVVGFVGIMFLSVGGVESFMFSAITSLLLGAFLWAAAIVYYKKYLSRIDPLIGNFTQLFIGAIIFSILGFATNDQSFPMNATYLVMIVYVSVGAFSVAWTIWLVLLRSEDATVVASSSFLVPLGALFLGWVLLAEGITFQSAFGTALVLFGVCMVNMSGVRIH